MPPTSAYNNTCRLSANVNWFMLVGCMDLDIVRPIVSGTTGSCGNSKTVPHKWYQPKLYQRSNLRNVGKTLPMPLVNSSALTHLLIRK